MTARNVVDIIRDLWAAYGPPEPVVYVSPATKAAWDARAGDEAPLTHVYAGWTRYRIVVSTGVEPVCGEGVVAILDWGKAGTA